MHGVSFFEVFVILFLYFIPSIVAAYRKHSKSTAIRVLNILAGWTFVGWIVAVVWAYTEDNRKEKNER